MFSQLFARGIVFLCVIALSACGGGGGGGGGDGSGGLTAQTIAFAQAGPVTLQVGDSLANPASGGAGSGAITYSSTRSDVVAVDGAGQITAGSVGNAVITATKAVDARYASASASYAVTVSQRAQSIAFGDAGPIELQVNQTHDAHFTAPGSGSVLYRSSDETVAVVDWTGRVTAVGPGTAIITVEKGGDAHYLAATGTLSIVVRNAQQLTFAQLGPLAMAIGDRIINIASGPGTGEVTYHSSDISIASADAAVVTAAASGTATITAEKAADNYYAAASATYTVKVSGLAMQTFIGASDTAVSIAGATLGDLLYRSLDANCNIANFSACSGYQADTSPTGGIDAAATLSRPGYYIFKRGASQASVVVTTEHFAGRYNHRLLTFDNQLWIIGGDDGSGQLSDVWASSDGVSWTQKTAAAAFGARSSFGAVAFNNKLWVTGGFNAPTFFGGDMWSSADGVTWTQAATNLSFGYRFQQQLVAYHNKLWLIGGTTDGSNGRNDVWSSSDGINWTQVTAAAPFSARREHRVVVYNDKMWLIGGCDGGASCNFFSGGNSDVWTSTDGANWTQVYAGSPSSFLVGVPTVVFNNQLCLVGNSSAFSSDGLQWQTIANVGQGFDYRHYQQAAVFKNRLWVVGGFDDAGAARDDVWSSADGGNWLQHTSRPGFSPRSGQQVVRFNDGLWMPGQLWMFGGDSGGITGALEDTWASVDGVLWQRQARMADFGVRRGHQVVKFKDKLWLIGGAGNGGGLGNNDRNDVWSSTDGMRWVRVVEHAPFEARSDHRVVVFDDKLWVIGGLINEGMDKTGDVWSSEDGVTWTQRSVFQLPARSGHEALVYGNKLWVIGGSNIVNTALNDVWSSSDGVTWHQETASAAFSPRAGLRAGVFYSKLLVVGGGGNNDVWQSIDGVNWTQLTAHAAFSPRNDHSLMIYNGRYQDSLMLIGGGLPPVRYNDVWGSIDGIEWRQGARWVFDL